MKESLNFGGDSPVRRSSDADERLARALAERELFLQRQPHLRAYQAEIDRLLDNSGNQQGRLAVLATLIQGKLLDLQRELTGLSEFTRRTGNMH